MNSGPVEHSIERLVVRTYESQDQAAALHLYDHGLLAGQVNPYDTAADIESIHEEYLTDQHNHFWVAVVDEQVVGMIGVVRDEEHIAEIRRLRVARQWQATPIAATLLETALAHCRHHGYLKVRLDTRFDPNAARDLFDRFGFQHTRTRNVHDKELLEFYLDLYRGKKREGTD